MQLFKQFRAAGGSKAMQDKLIRDFQSLNKKMLETTKQTRTPAPLPQARGRLALNCLLAAEDLMGQHPSTAGGGGGGMGAAIAGGDEASKPLLAEDNFEETQQQSRLQNNEDQIMQRDKAIQDIESTVADVAEIMQDLAVVVKHFRRRTTYKKDMVKIHHALAQHVAEGPQLGHAVNQALKAFAGVLKIGPPPLGGLGREMADILKHMQV